MSHENIYSLGEREETRPHPGPRYRSRHEFIVRQEVKDRLSDHRTFGFPLEPLHPPKDFLRKRSRSAAPFRKPPADHNHFEVRLKDPLEHRGGLIIHREVNHLKENIHRAASAKPRRPKTSGHSRVDNHRGDSFQLDASGLVPKYVLQQPKFGKVPKYIQERKKEAEQRMKEEQERKQKTSLGPKLISETERMELLKGLRSNWETLQQVYKKLSLLTDTIPKKARKTKLENELKQIEKDMLFLEHNRFIAIEDSF